MTTFVTIIYVTAVVVLILVVLLQAGRGGGLGTALGGGASQSVFGGSGGADFLAKLTQGLAAAFMLGAVYLAYASSHVGSDRLQEESDRLGGKAELPEEDDEINYEMIGPRPLELPAAGADANARTGKSEVSDAPTDPEAEPSEQSDTPAVDGVEPAAENDGEALPPDGEPRPADGEQP